MSEQIIKHPPTQPQLTQSMPSSIPSTPPTPSTPKSTPNSPYLLRLSGCQTKLKVKTMKSPR